MPLWGMENDLMNGFLLEGEARSNVNASGGRSRLQFIAIAHSPEDAIGIVGKLGFPVAKIIDSARLSWSALSRLTCVKTMRRLYEHP